MVNSWTHAGVHRSFCISETDIGSACAKDVRVNSTLSNIENSVEDVPHALIHLDWAEGDKLTATGVHDQTPTTRIPDNNLRRFAGSHAKTSGPHQQPEDLGIKTAEPYVQSPAPGSRLPGLSGQHGLAVDYIVYTPPPHQRGLFSSTIDANL